MNNIPASAPPDKSPKVSNEGITPELSVSGSLIMLKTTAQIKTVQYKLTTKNKVKLNRTKRIKLK